jgi:hypothetical protein
VSLDYLDLLLVRETRAATLAEPRIETAAAAPEAGPSGWGEVIEEREVPYFPPTATAGPHAAAQPPRGDAQPHPSVHAAVFPAAIDRTADQPAVAAPALPPRVPARHAAHEIVQEDAAAPRRLPTREAAEKPVTVVDPRPARAETEKAPLPQIQLTPQPQEPARPVATRPATMASVAPEPAIPQPVTIRIDRVEVRAVPAAAPPAPASARPRPRVSLDEFLGRRSGARRE